MSYIDLHIEKEKIHVVERVNGKRVYKTYDPDYSFYVMSPNGEYKSMFGDRCKKITPTTGQERRKLVMQYANVPKFESRAKIDFRCLEQNYRNQDPPKLHVAFYDIEADFDHEMGYSSPADALNKITSISVYLTWTKQMICLAIPPVGMSIEEAEATANIVGDTIICKTEKEMLNYFLDVIEDADVLSGWNSTLYDMPYITNRIIRVLGKHEARRLCLFNQMPEKRDIEFNGKIQQTYDLVGRISLDYMELYKKYSFEEHQSYALQAIAEEELNESKVQYDGSLDELYNTDFQKFLEYNIHDTRLLVKLDEKKKYIELVNLIAHDNCVLLPTTMGAVATTQNAIVMKAHDLGVVVMDRNDTAEEFPAAGGWVQTAKQGLHKWVGVLDLASLYPSTIRAFNMSNETIVGQIRLDETNTAIREYLAAKKSNTFADWWNDKFNVIEMDYFYNQDNVRRLDIDMEDGTHLSLTGAELYNLIFSGEVPWIITANGTIFRSDIEGIIPQLLSGWYADRKRMQGISKGFEALKEGINIPERLLK